MLAVVEKTCEKTADLFARAYKRPWEFPWGRKGPIDCLIREYTVI